MNKLLCYLNKNVKTVLFVVSFVIISVHKGSVVSCMVTLITQIIINFVVMPPPMLSFDNFHNLSLQGMVYFLTL